MWWRRKVSPEVAVALARVRIFSALPPRDLERLASACVLKNFSAGETILEEGSVGLGMFIITSGEIEVFKTHDGRKIALAVLRDGAVLGEMALLDDQPRSASAAALEDTECLLLTRDRFRTLVKRRPRIAEPIVRPLAGLVRELNEQVIEARSQTAPTLQRLDSTSSTDLVSLDALPASAELTSTEAAESGVSLAEADDQWLVQDLQIDGPATPAEGSVDDSDSSPDALRAPYALAMTGAVGFGESVRLCEVFLRSLDEASGLGEGRPIGDVLRDRPASLTTAGMKSWEHGRRLPSRLLGIFRDHLRSDWRQE